MCAWSKEEAIARLEALKAEQERIQKELAEMMETEVSSCRESYNIPVLKREIDPKKIEFSIYNNQKYLLHQPR